MKVLMPLARHKVEELLPLVEENVKETEVGEEGLAGLIGIVEQGGPQAEIRFGS